MSRIVHALTVGAAAWFLGAGAARAQEDAEPLSDVTCVYDGLISDDSYERVAESYLYDDLTEKDLDYVLDVLNGAAGGCADEHGWNEELTELGKELGVYGVVVDYLGEELLYAGVSEETMEELFLVIEELSDDDLSTFVETDWRANGAFVARHKSALVAAGWPDDEEVVLMAMIIMEVSSHASEVVLFFAAAQTSEEN